VRRLLLVLLLAAAAPAHAYCIVNQLRDREIAVEQDIHPDPLRDERHLKLRLAPGARHCCDFHNLDCNPGGRDTSLVGLAVSIPGEPPYQCRVPENAVEPSIKVMGGGTLRVVPNPRARSAFPYVVRLAAHGGKDLTGPRGVACTPVKPKGKP
jgi:hypothetical protein